MHSHSWRIGSRRVARGAWLAAAAVLLAPVIRLRRCGAPDAGRRGRARPVAAGRPRCCSGLTCAALRRRRDGRWAMDRRTAFSRARAAAAAACRRRVWPRSETRSSFAGCLFYTAEVDNVASDDAMATSFLVTNPGAEPRRSVLQQPGGGGTWMRDRAGADRGWRVGAPARAGGLEAVRSGVARGGRAARLERPARDGRADSERRRRRDRAELGGTMLAARARARLALSRDDVPAGRYGGGRRTADGRAARDA